MKKNRVWVVLVGLFCLITSGATVYATSYHVENQVGVRFFNSTSTTNSTTSTTSSSTTEPSTSSSSSTMQTTSSSLPETKISEKREGLLFWGNSGGGTGGTTRYYADDKLLPSTGELVHLALPFAGVFLMMLVFFYLRKNKGEKA